MAEAFVEARTSGLPVAAGPGPEALRPAVVPLSLGLPVAGDGYRSVGAMPVFELVVTCTEGATTLAVLGELDVEAAPMLARSLESLPGEPGAPSLVVDLDGVSFLDAAGLRAFVPSIRRLAARGERLVVRRPSPLARTVLELSGLAAGLSIEG